MNLRFWLKYSCYQMIVFIGLLYAVTVTAQPEDKDQIRAVMLAHWQRPDAPLMVDPIIVSGENAIAGWAQGAKGGRALLRRQNDVWQVYVCGDDRLKTASALQQAGISANDAALMARDLAVAEASLPTNQIRRFSTFEGIMPVSSNHGTANLHHH